MRINPLSTSRANAATATLALTGCMMLASAFGQSSMPPGAIKQDPRAAASLAAGNGIWKAVVPPTRMAGAFDDNDPVGVITGRKIPADCSINWTDPDTHRLFCFSSATSLVYFLNAPKANTARAEKAWDMLKRAPTG